ncbi:arsenate reductase [Loigolactobacillus coryniformis subsp. coryniformis]|jgi:arsenate reductase|uniref:Arsenate reductase n=1 Tax=Loigolactobacillus coryniformis subsp. coryniformis KCTC 3167 = DSM 20001 TaxID=913848 RepID=A0A0R1F6C7_9LACO|nr:arsenate reductase (thioredoxin) [Loigolactobacillus coryniformis]ATO54520.1 arsenate reductase (thioredoxin) [Loigolactobacillus coryniformis subsp. coryniformis KCTC 3167 = DSM 20001]KRK17337.1 arsenate reductase [Loigolactobacillus coryniformis subsp. coryniformis KCTC 3167 = DSM 20001]OEH90005.1 arsenate reductase [Loigolactobacillus coryniformis subsp. coryniformis]
MPQIYFLCTGNSCRSQMAEGFARQYFGQQWRIASAGIETHGLNPRAVQVMAEKGIDISQYHSKLIDIDYLNSSDLVVTLCGDARDRCPVTPPTVKKQHWPLPDPAQVQGSEAEILTVFRQVRDEIERRVQALV